MILINTLKALLKRINRFLARRFSKIIEVNKKYEKPRIKMNLLTSICLLFLRLYLLFLVAILFYKFYTLVR
jgi:hypothetical protein